MKKLKRMLLILCMTTMGCEDLLQTQTSMTIPTHYLAFVDVSGSIEIQQIERWMGQIQTKLLSKLRCGDRLTILPIHEETAGAAPVLDIALPMFEGELTLSEMVACRKTLATGVSKFKKALIVLTSARAKQTDILHLIPRIADEHHSMDHRKLEVYLLTDFLNATRELDLEKTELTPESMNGVIQTILARKGWGPSLLAGVELYCWVEGHTAGTHAGLNNFVRLKRFWGTLFDGVGATVKEFKAVR